jgi:hypothetical protein
MRAFQLETWEARARERFRRSVGSDPERSRARLVVDLDAARGLDEVIRWAGGRGVSVAFTNRRDAGVFSPDDKTIYINSTQTFERQLFVLLHECGHLLVGSERPGAHHRFKLGYPSSDDPNLRGKFIHRCAVLEEEFEAWHRGHRLAKKLGIEIAEDRWAELKATFIKSYIKWTMKHDDYW